MPKGIFERTEEHNRNIAKSRMGSKNPMWKGNRAGLDAIHIWVRARLKKPKFCQNCHKKKPYDLANISQEYKRDTNDFKWLCRKCHMTEDNRIKNLIMLARNISKETREKMSRSQMGKKNSFYRKHHAAETKRKISETKRRRSKNL